MREESAPEGRLVEKIWLTLGKGQTLYVDPSGPLGPGLNRVFVTNRDGRVDVFADASSGSHFRFSRGSGAQGDPDFVIRNLGSAESIADILENRFWSQFNWSELIAYHKDRSFRRKVRRRILKLAREFEARAAEELNAIPKPSSD